MRIIPIGKVMTLNQVWKIELIVFSIIGIRVCYNPLFHPIVWPKCFFDSDCKDSTWWRCYRRMYCENWRFCAKCVSIKLNLDRNAYLVSALLRMINGKTIHAQSNVTAGTSNLCSLFFFQATAGATSSPRFICDWQVFAHICHCSSTLTVGTGQTHCSPLWSHCLIFTKGNELLC